MMFFYKNMLCPKPRRSLVFTLPGHSLPSQYRSLLPVSDPEVQRVLRAERASRQIRNATLALTALLFLIVVVIIALIVAFQVSVDKQSEPLLFADTEHILVDKIHTLSSNVTKHRPHSDLIIQTQEGIPCRRQCVEYSAFKFKASCDDGMCKCHSEFYDDVTCLPTFASCHIKMYPLTMTSVAVSFSGQAQNVYACFSKDTYALNKPPASTTRLPDDCKAKQEAYMTITDHMIGSKDISERALEETATSSSLITPHEDFIKEADNSLKENVTPENRASVSSKTLSSLAADTSYIYNTHEIATDASEVATEDGELIDTSPEVHVISIYGNCRAPSTSLLVTSNKKISITLVLASYEPLVWNVTVGDSVEVQNIFLISNHRVSKGQVSISQSQTPDAKRTSDHTDQSQFPPVTRKLLRTGYGNDRMSGNTPQLLRDIWQTIGPVKAFVGAAHADMIRYKVD